MLKKKKKESATFSFSISLSSLLGCDVTIVQYFLFRYILRLECCLPLKAGCTLEDLMGTFTFSRGSNDASTDVYPTGSVCRERRDADVFCR